MPYAEKPIFCAVTSRFSLVSLVMMRAGMPTAVAPAGTALSTTELEPTLAPSPTVKLPSTFAPALTITPLANVGWRFAPRSSEVPPSVTP